MGFLWINEIPRVKRLIRHALYYLSAQAKRRYRTSPWRNNRDSNSQQNLYNKSYLIKSYGKVIYLHFIVGVGQQSDQHVDQHNDRQNQKHYKEDTNDCIWPDVMGFQCLQIRQAKDGPYKMGRCFK